MKLTETDVKSIIWNDHPDWKIVPDTEKIIDQRRWMTAYTGVFEHTTTGKFYCFYWDMPSTEDSGDGPEIFTIKGYYEPNEVHKVTKTVEVWDSVEKTD